MSAFTQLFLSGLILRDGQIIGTEETSADGKVTLTDLPNGCYEIEETDVPKPYILDTNNRKTVWIDAEKDQDVVVDFVNSTKPGLRLLKIDQQTGESLSGVQFRIRVVNGN